jgi:hypothetical protein
MGAEDRNINAYLVRVSTDEHSLCNPWRSMRELVKLPHCLRTKESDSNKKVQWLEIREKKRNCKNSTSSTREEGENSFRNIAVKQKELRVLVSTKQSFFFFFN